MALSQAVSECIDSIKRVNLLLMETKELESTSSLSIQLSISVWFCAVFEQNGMLFSSQLFQLEWREQCKSVTTIKFAATNRWEKLLNLFHCAFTEHSQIVQLNEFFDFSWAEGLSFNDAIITEVLTVLLDDSPIHLLTPRLMGEIYEQTMELDLASQQSKKSTGTFYTPTWLVDRLIDEAIEFGDWNVYPTICDPSCGVGFFLLRWLDRMYDHFKDALVKYIYGVDINHRSVQIAQLLLWWSVGSKNVSLSSLKHQIRSGDALLGWNPSTSVKSFIDWGYVKRSDNRNIIKELNAADKDFQSRNPNIVDYLTSNNSPEVSQALFDRMLIPKTREHISSVPTLQSIYSIAKQDIDIDFQGRSIHWSFEFPEVFDVGGFDCVLGNPPYVSAKTMAQEQPYVRDAVGRLYDSAKGNWDLYVPFVELGVSLLKPKGIVSFLTPNKIIGADYVRKLHSKVLFENRICSVLDFTKVQTFSSAKVSVVGLVVQKSDESDEIVFFKQTSLDGRDFEYCIHQQKLTSLPSGYIGFPLSGVDLSLMDLFPGQFQLKDMAQVSDGASTKEAYLISEFIQENEHVDVNDGSILKLVNTGTIDPFVLHWGTQNIRYLGFNGMYPCISLEKLKEVAPKRVSSALESTVVVGGMGKRIEAAVAPSGYLCGKSAVSRICIEVYLE